MHGLWYTRSWADLFREALIHAVLTGFYLPALTVKCVSSMVIVTLIGLQHLASLFVHPDGLIPNSFIFPGAVALAILAYFRDSKILLFAGIYSFTSKYNYLHSVLTREERANFLGEWDDPVNELSKLLVSLLFFAVFGLLLPWPSCIKFIRTCLGYQPVTYFISPKTRWFSEILVVKDALVSVTSPSALRNSKKHIHI
jgi:hypothetical protein